MKGLKKISDKTQNTKSNDRSTWVALYYSYTTDTVYDKPGDGRHKITDLINPNTPQDIQETVEYFNRL